MNYAMADAYDELGDTTVIVGCPVKERLSNRVIRFFYQTVLATFSQNVSSTRTKPSSPFVHKCYSYHAFGDTRTRTQRIYKYHPDEMTGRLDQRTRSIGREGLREHFLSVSERCLSTVQRSSPTCT